MRIRRSCSLDVDYALQAQQIKCRFVEKGYNAQVLDEVIHEVGLTSQESCLMPRERSRNDKQDWGFISNFHGQYRDIESIIKRHWDILGMDKTLGTCCQKFLPSFTEGQLPLVIGW